MMKAHIARAGRPFNDRVPRPPAHAIPANRRRPPADQRAGPMPPPIEPRPDWIGRTAIVAAPGPSLAKVKLTWGLAARPMIVVNDAWRLFPDADVLYSCDAKWWDYHNGVPDFAGEKWSSQGSVPANNKEAAAARWDLRLVGGKAEAGFSLDQRWINYGNNSGFQAINLALLFGSRRVILVGFDMRKVEGQMHFFGNHPPELDMGDSLVIMRAYFEAAAKRLPPGVEIINCTPGSALPSTCFPVMELADALAMG